MFHVVIPARFGSTRLPAMPLLEIGDRPLIQWVWQSAVASGAAIQHDDTAAANAADAQDGWQRMLAWFKAHGVRAA